MKILVTGGAGYIGSHTCVELLNAGYEVIIVDNLSNSKLESIRRINELTGKVCKFYKADIRDREYLEKIFSENEINAVIHFAGLKSVGESVSAPIKYFQNNVVGTLNLCEVMEKFGVNKLVFSSSATVYGVQESIPLTEELPIKANNPYGRTKLMIEEILHDVSNANSKWGIAILRYFNPVGAHISGRIGEDPNGIPNNLLPYITNVALGKLPKLNILGNDYNTYDGTGIRDYIHVVDLSLGHIKALESVNRKTGVNTYNLGTGTGYSVLDMVHYFEKTTGVNIPYKVVGRRDGDIAVSIADPSKAEKELNWKAKKNIKEMILDAWNWQINNPNGYLIEESLSNNIK
ncbi:UDP-glucose 4-epimerase GalE [Bacillus sp. 1P02SD]|uniref:UDP-glucose 4-epimerase GalE n=1 Tax=Bacillus sp. 1P02SD TaxID=3132264 RepID=UPI0039A048F8